MATPDWQTDELAEEWVEDDDDDDEDDDDDGSDLSLTRDIHGSLRVTPDRSVLETEYAPPGTFVVREDQPPPVLPKTPGRGAKFGADIFTPLKLERMFDPPSPPQHRPSPQASTSQPQPPSNKPSTRATPAAPSPLSQVYVPSPDPTKSIVIHDLSREDDAGQEQSPNEIIETDIPNLSFNGRKPSSHCQFTFSMPPRRDSNSLHPASAATSPMHSNASPFLSAPSGIAAVQSTPHGRPAHDPKSANPLVGALTPMSDPRLRLFQFQYDTFTREHLSAIVDSIAVNSRSPSTDAFSPTNPTPTTPFTPIPEETSEGDHSYSRLRSAKRIKLSQSQSKPAPAPEEREQHSSSSSGQKSASSQQTGTTHFIYGPSQSLPRTESSSQLQHSTIPGLGALPPASSSQFLYSHAQEAPERPTLRRDYVSESRSLMSQIKKARDFSTISTVASLRPSSPSDEEDDGDDTRSTIRDVDTRPARHTPAHIRVPSDPRLEGVEVDPYGPSPPMSAAPTMTASAAGTLASRAPSSIGYRQQAAELMSQIRSGLTPRLVSGATDSTHVEHGHADKSSMVLSKDDIEWARQDPVVVMHVERIPGLGNGPIGEDSDEEAGIDPYAFTGHRRAETSATQVNASGPRKRMRTMSVAEEEDLAASTARMSLRGSTSRLRRQEEDDLAASTARMSLRGSTSRAPMRRPAMVTIPPTPEQTQLGAATNRVAHSAGVDARLLVPPEVVLPGMGLAHPSGSVRARANEDLNRFVSSSTATSGTGTTLTVGSVDSCVKHAGPKQITNIAPGDVGVPERVGRMVFDKVMMRWVRNTHEAMQAAETVDERDEGEGESEDPFRDIESLRSEDERSRRGDSVLRDDVHVPGVLEDVVEEDEEERDLNSFSFDGSSMGVVQVMTGVDSGEGLAPQYGDITATTESIDGDGEGEGDEGADFLEMSGATSDLTTDEDGTDPMAAPWPMPPGAPSPSIVPSPARPPPDAGGTWSTSTWPKATPSPFTPHSAVRASSGTPLSALKDPSRRYATPQGRGHQRSVSFSDGKREGPIVGVQEISASAASDLGDSQASREDLFVPSARSRRIMDMMQDLDGSSFEDDSPSKDAGRPPTAELQPLTARRPSTSPSKVAPTVSARINGDVSRRVFSRTQPFLQQQQQQQKEKEQSRDTSRASRANATFLTECSFAVSHDRLVQVITDVQPFEPHWEDLPAIDLSGKNLDSVARLKEFLPKLDTIALNSNQLCYLSGVPATVRTLSVASNRLTGLTSFNHLTNLGHLDISRNEIESLRQLACLRHLRELRADGNRITSLDGLQKMSGLVKLSVQENRIGAVDLSEYQWTRLEMLNLSHNRVEDIAELASLSALISLNLDNNALAGIECAAALPRLHILRLSGNKVQRLNVAPFPNLRTLYADNNSLTGLVKAHRLGKLENLSLRNQGGKGLRLDLRDVRDVKRLYLSGNRMDAAFLTEACYNLIYLELAACRLTALPGDLGRLTPNLRVLNLNYNFLDDAGIAALEGLGRLKKLTIIGSRLKSSKALVRCVRGMPEVEMLDFRMNPCTLGWYLPLLVRDVPGALQPSEGGGGRALEDEGRGWRELDAKFRRDLPDDAYVGRLAYRGLVMRACGRIKLLDGVEVTEKEKEKAGRLLVSLVGKRKEGR